MNEFSRQVIDHIRRPRPTPAPPTLEALGPMIGERIRGFFDGHEESPAPPEPPKEPGSPPLSGWDVLLEESEQEPEPGLKDLDARWAEFIKARTEKAEAEAVERKRQFMEDFYEELHEVIGKPVAEMNTDELKRAKAYTEARLKHEQLKGDSSNE